MKAYTIQAWNKETQDTVETEISKFTLVKLGCENEPKKFIFEWMALRDIETLAEMCEYINDLDFNVEVVA